MNAISSTRRQKLALLNSDLLTATVLSWVAGYIDAAGFLKLNGLFTVHLTGNFVVAGIQIAGVSEALVWVRLAVIPVFIAAVILTTVFSRKLHPSRSSFLWFEAVTLLLFAIVGILIVPAGTLPVAAQTMFVAGSTGVFAMGVQNTLMREIYSSLSPTTVMTGNLTQFTIDIARIAFIRDYQQLNNVSQQKHEIWQRIRKFGGALAGFGVGTIVGTLLTRSFNFWSILLPTAVVGCLALNARSIERLSKHAVRSS
jgi:uncharacterized membrane protein YoaK (UPF0700 family)